MSNGYEFSAICLQETWLSSVSDTSLFKAMDIIKFHKIKCVRHMHVSQFTLVKHFSFGTIDLNINSQIWEGQIIEIANIQSNKSLIL